MQEVARRYYPNAVEGVQLPRALGHGVTLHDPTKLEPLLPGGPRLPGEYRAAEPRSHLRDKLLIVRQDVLLCKPAQIFHGHLQILGPRGDDGHSGAGDGMREAQFFRVERHP